MTEPPLDPPPTELAIVEELNEELESSPSTSTSKTSPHKLLTGFWQKATEKITPHLPVDRFAQMIVGWFGVREEKVAEILATVRAKLPTTEAILIGKPQAGKSSIVRGLTGVSAEIIGSGFRPHTQHSQRYAYPSEELPLLIFTDTVGLGDVNQDPQRIIEDIAGNLEKQNERAKILILTVKINDFAVDTLKNIAQQLRQRHPAIPCLLVATCLHEVYPPTLTAHPPYPPAIEELNRAFKAMDKGLGAICDRSILIDFTLEADGFTPVFYGLEALRDALAELLPAAESQAIHQLLDSEAGEQIGNLYRDVGRHYILAFSVIAATLAAVRAGRTTSRPPQP